MQLHTEASALCNINIMDTNKKRGMWWIWCPHICRARRQRTKPFSFAAGFLHTVAASMHEKDEVTFGCSINFKGFYTIKHNVSRSHYTLSLLFLVSLWYFANAVTKFLYFNLVYQYAGGYCQSCLSAAEQRGIFTIKRTLTYFSDITYLKFQKWLEDQMGANGGWRIPVGAWSSLTCLS